MRDSASKRHSGQWLTFLGLLAAGLAFQPGCSFFKSATPAEEEKPKSQALKRFEVPDNTDPALAPRRRDD